MVSFKSLPVLLLGALVAVTASGAPLDGEKTAELHTRDNDGYSRGPSGAGDIRWSTFAGATTGCGKYYYDGQTDGQLLGGTRSSSECGKKYEVVFDTGKKVTVTIVDTCTGCDLLLSKAAFESSGLGVGIGRITGKWKSLGY